MGRFWERQDEEQGKDDRTAGKSIEVDLSNLKTELTGHVDTKFNEVAESMKAINARFAKDDEEREISRKKREQEASANHKTLSAEEEAEALLQNPSQFINGQINRTTQFALLALAKQQKLETLETAEYYAGEIKKRTDELIEGESNLALRANPSFIQNCYKIALADNMEAVTKGEAKKKAGFYSSGDSNASGKGEEGEGKIVVQLRDNKSSYAMRQLGLTEDDLVAAAKDGAINGLEVVR